MPCIMESCSSHRQLLRLWHRRIGCNWRWRETRGPRPFAGLSYLVSGPVPADHLVELRRLTVVAVHDEFNADHRLSIRVRLYTNSITCDGVNWGGAAACQADKDLGLRPHNGARGRRFTFRHAELLALSTHLDQLMQLCSKYPFFPRRRAPQLPPVWAPVSRAVASHLSVAAPALARLGREKDGTILLPLESVLCCQEPVQHYYADLSRFPKRQVFAIEQPAFDLAGSVGPISFDFYSSRFAPARPSCEVSQA
jgi:hypothetical protein